MSSSNRDQVWPIVDFYGSYSGRCGYCKSPDGKISVGLRGYFIPVDLYEKMINRNWRRSGPWFYQPANDKICCKQYAIRVNVNNFAPRREHKKVLKKIENFLKFGAISRPQNPTNHLLSTSTSLSQYQSSSSSSSSSLSSSSSSSLSSKKKANSEDSQKKTRHENSSIKNQIMRLEEMVSNALKAALKNEKTLSFIFHYITGIQKIQITERNIDDCVIDFLRPKITKTSTQNKRKSKPKGDYSCNIALQIYGQIQKKRKYSKFSSFQEELKSTNHDEFFQDKQITPHGIASLIMKYFESDKCDFIEKVECFENGYVNFFLTDDMIGEIKKEHSIEIIKSGSFQKKLNENNDNASSHEIKCHTLDMVIKKAKYDDESFELYKKYQINIHGDEPGDVTKKRYKNFLVDNPLVGPTSTEISDLSKQSSFFSGYGTYHIQYVLDKKKIIGISVVDVLPSGLSSVYFFYDTDYSFLSLGKYSAIKEIELSKQIPSFSYYQLGYYIHNCKKMKYKAQFEPSEMLCPIHYKWVPTTQCTELLAQQQYCSFYNPPPISELSKKKGGKDQSMVSSNQDTESTVNKMIALFKNEAIPMRLLKMINNFTHSEEENIHLFAKSFGEELAQQVLYYIS